MIASRLKILKFVKSQHLNYASITKIVTFFDETDSNVVRNMIGDAQLDGHLKFIMGHYALTREGKEYVRTALS